jgi:glutamyl-tRNA synthetase
MDNKIRTRFAPSPTGYLHLGGLRTALYNYLFARQNDGNFILRIEDTDQKRFVEGAVENLIRTLNWSGLNWDEGPDKGGEYGPYFQSQRLKLYQDYARQLVKEKKAYYCFCTPERLERLRKMQAKMKQPPRYDRHCLSLSEDEIEAKLKQNVPYVIRLLVPRNEKITFTDLVRGKITFELENVDDQILLKSDGFPTYHLANIIDDHFMKISHVIRGEEWLSSMPKHLLLYRYFNWTPPQFAHLPLILNPDRTKLSKRQGDVAVEDYMKRGFLPEGLLNYLALLGWSNKDNRDFFSLDELVQNFKIENINKSGAIFDINKLIHINGYHLEKKSIEEKFQLLKNFLTQHKEIKLNDEWLQEFTQYLGNRIKYLEQVYTYLNPFISEIEKYDEKGERKFFNSVGLEILQKVLFRIEKLDNWTVNEIEQEVKMAVEEIEVSFGKIAQTLRVALTGQTVSLGIFETIYLLGEEKTKKRLNQAISYIKKR